MGERPDRCAGTPTDRSAYQRVEAGDRAQQRSAARADGATGQRRVLAPGRASASRDRRGKGKSEGDSFQRDKLQGTLAVR